MAVQRATDTLAGKEQPSYECHLMNPTYLMNAIATRSGTRFTNGQPKKLDPVSRNTHFPDTSVF